MDGRVRPTSLSSTRIAIDLGTSSCAAAVWRDGTVHVIPNEFGRRSTPSFVAFTDKKRLLGEQAQKLVQRRPENVLFDVKRLIGRDYEEINQRTGGTCWPFKITGDRDRSTEIRVEVSSEFLRSLLNEERRSIHSDVARSSEAVRSERERTVSGDSSPASAPTRGTKRIDHPPNLPPRAPALPANLPDSSAGDLPIPHPCRTRPAEVESTLFAPEEILAMLLAKMKSLGEAFLQGSELSVAAITVPSCYNDRQRRATKRAAEIAGFTDVVLADEATVAALSYAHHMGMLSGERGDPLQANVGRGASKIIVFALGGGSFDVALVTIADGRLRVQAVAGNPSLGGKDFDDKVIDLIMRDCVRKSGDVREVSRGALRRLRVASEKAKRDLTLLNDATIEVESAFQDQEDIKMRLERGQFERVCERLFEECMQSLFGVLGETRTRKEDVDDVVLVGGSTRIPKIVEMLRDFFGREPVPLFHQDEAVVRGAALLTAFAGQVFHVNPLEIAFGSSEGKSGEVRFPMRPGRMRISIPRRRFFYRCRPTEWCTEVWEKRCISRNLVRMGVLVAELEDELLSETFEREGACMDVHLWMNKSGVLSLPAAQRRFQGGVMSFYKVRQYTVEEVRLWKNRARQLIAFERKCAQVRQARHRWQKYGVEVARQEAEIPAWLRSVIWSLRLEVDQLLQGAEEEERGWSAAVFESQFTEFCRLCELVFGEMWARSLSSRKFLVVDRWRSEDIELCLRNLASQADGGRNRTGSSNAETRAGADLCDLVVRLPINRLPARRTEVDQKLHNMDIAADYRMSPQFLRDQGVSYVIVGTEGGNPEWNRIVGLQVAMAVHAGLLVILRIEGRRQAEQKIRRKREKDQENVRGEQIENQDDLWDQEEEGGTLWDQGQEIRHCQEQLAAVIRVVGSDWRNISLAYISPRFDMWTAPSLETAAMMEAPDTSLLLGDVVGTVEHLRRVIQTSISPDAASATPILFGGNVTESIWNALTKHKEIDGFLLEHALRDPDFLGRIKAPRWKSRGKFLLCVEMDKDQDLNHSRANTLMSCSKALEQEGLCVIVAAALSDCSYNHTGDGNSGRGRRILRQPDLKKHGGAGAGAAAWSAQLIPVLGGPQDVGTNPMTIDDQLSKLAEELVGTNGRWEKVVLEYRHPPEENTSHTTHLKAVDSALNRIRRWLFMHINPETAEAVYIIFSLDDNYQAPLTLPDIVKLPNLDGVVGERSADWLEEVVIGWRYGEALGAKLCKLGKDFKKFKKNEWDAQCQAGNCPCGVGRHADFLSAATLRLLREDRYLHVITNDTGVTNNGQLQLMINSGLNHILVRALDEDFALSKVERALDEILTTPRCDEELSMEEEREVKKTVIRNVKASIRDYYVRHMYISEEPINAIAIRSEIEWLAGRFLICPTDKAANTTTFVCINFIRRLALQRLSGPDFVPVPEQPAQVAARLLKEASTIAPACLLEGRPQLPHVMTVYKAHKESFRWITNTAGSVLSPVAKLCDCLLNLLAADVQAVSGTLRQEESTSSTNLARLAIACDIADKVRPPKSLPKSANRAIDSKMSSSGSVVELAKKPCTQVRITRYAKKVFPPRVDKQVPLLDPVVRRSRIRRGAIRVLVAKLGVGLVAADEVVPQVVVDLEGRVDCGTMECRERASEKRFHFPGM
ncbi:hypothetical protein CBR_g52415 [Chara braunii]|uniref:Uncharacterized protein n=1 Tax=Chara braunii TaxID=69332 RepID=A0A388MA80_CHABU|nr:hypothetical protein CBR_g52415 [Chara braunii]|eukprot:GBG91460.1 hypothetical protein CBR_g52415 [Chara braunii]